MPRIEVLPLALETALAGCTLYPAGHTRQEAALDLVFKALSEILSAEGAITVGLSGDTLILNGTPLFEESAKATRFIDRLNERGVLSVRIDPGVTREELKQFFLALCRKEGDAATTALHTQLLSLGVTAIHVDDTAIKETFRSAADAQVPLVSNISRKVRHILVNAISEALEAVASGDELDVEKLEDATTDVTKMIQRDKQEMVALTSQAYHDHFTYNHSVNACILASALAETFIDRHADLNRIAQAALLHDVGKICISEQILYKPGRLTDEEFAIMRSHPDRGAEILLRCKDVDPLCILVARGHHMCHDGSGYPKGGPKLAQHYLVALIEAVDVYEAMTARRPYKAPMAPDLALSLILTSAGTQFRPDILRVLLDIVGLYPAGSILDLAGGARARVLSVKPGEPLLPRIVLYQDAEGQPMASPEELTLDTTDCPPELKIVRCTHADAVAEEQKIPA